MHWYYLIIAIVTEVCGTVCMKLSAGFTRLVPSVLLFLFYGVAFCFLTLALKKMPVSTAYAIWSGLGTALIAAIGYVYFHETLTPIRVAGLIAIIFGVVAVNMSGNAH